MSFKALLVDKNDDGKVSANVTDLDDAQLPADGDVTVQPHHRERPFEGERVEAD